MKLLTQAHIPTIATIFPSDKDDLKQHTKELHYLAQHSKYFDVILNDGSHMQTEDPTVFYTWLDSDFETINIHVQYFIF